MEKDGIARIGYIGNYKVYSRLIREKAGIPFFDYNEFDKHIDEIWTHRNHGIYCYDESGNEVTVDSDQIICFLIDSGFLVKDRIDKIFIGFNRKFPGSLDDQGWFGVEIGTREELAHKKAITEEHGSSFDKYTSAVNYDSISLFLGKSLGKEISTDECAEILRNSFEKAQKNKTLAVVENQYDSQKQMSFFPIPIVNNENKRLFIKMNKNKSEIGYSEWFGAFVIAEDELKEELLSFYCFHVGSFIFQSLASANQFYDSLAHKAMRENWKWSDTSRDDRYSQPILKSYLEHTYYRLVDEDIERDNAQKKIVSYKGKSYFNSGLLDHNFRQIIIVGTEEVLEKDIPGLGVCRWTLLSELKAYSHNEHEIARMFREDELPAIASYFTDYREVVFDASLDIHTNDRHIFEDGVERGRLPKYKEEYEKVKDDEVEKELLLTRIARDFDSARERAKLMAERNYKLAVPQFYKENNEIQFLLPIYLGEREEAEKPQCALVLSLDKSGRRPYYRGETILTLDMAYNNTRLIAKPDVFWLNDLV